ncbi:hypothetical protein CY34DRAFT_649164 [Suillus luteus UH-Slu-Lm8-n1]|uniref:Uncharacterized protein n=1 Tax=Suillus luteus UH-Slu-Lm8-n1 TaxID=930992 RepID=A0A0D0AJ72_9AGAM|nr:hypothetical protein CY34DRAFT_649164 [Suillus luteus UH-Slu-Lm8-n1]
MLISLTLTCAIRNWLATDNRLYVVILKHNAFYYACGLFFSAVNVLTSLLLGYAYSSMFQEYVSAKVFWKATTYNPNHMCLVSKSSFIPYSPLECTSTCGMPTAIVIVS